MENDIDCHLFAESLNLDKVGKYGKFVEFEGDHSDSLQFMGHSTFRYHTDKLAKEKLTEADLFLAMENMQENLDRCIEAELKKDYKLQEKIKKIQEKTKQRIKKLKEKPTNKLREKYHYGNIEEYFKPDRFIQHSLEESSTS